MPNDGSPRNRDLLGLERDRTGGDLFGLRGGAGGMKIDHSSVRSCPSLRIVSERGAVRSMHSMR